jgi:hypothetical protein
LLANTIADDSNTVFYADGSIVLQSLLFGSKASGDTISIFGGKPVMHLPRSFGVRVVGFPSCLCLYLLLMRGFDKGTVSRWRIPYMITFLSLVVTPAIDRIILNYFCK